MRVCDGRSDGNTAAYVTGRQDRPSPGSPEGEKKEGKKDENRTLEPREGVIEREKRDMFCGGECSWNLIDCEAGTGTL